jgi:flagellar L-ring protein FlgH
MRHLIPLLLCGLSACSTVPPRPEPSDAEAMSASMKALEAPTPGAIYNANAGIALFEDAKARHVGDLVTILLVERTTAQKKAATSSNKASSAEITDVTVLGQPLGINTGVGGQRSFAGSGDSTQSNKLEGSVTAMVVARLPNGVLQLRGEKQIELNQGSEVVRIEGLVRSIDIASNNTVPSDRIANARVTYKGRGALADANSQDWLSRFFSSPWFPF